MPKKQTAPPPPDVQEISENMMDSNEVIEETTQTSEAEPVVMDEAINEIDLLQIKLKEAHAKADEYLDGWQRAKAEFANYKKRVNRDREQNDKDAVGRVVRRYLPIVDDLERALKDRPKEGDTAAWASGIELIYRKMVSILENDGVTPIEADGEMFDPNFHEAIAQIPSKEYESGQIIEVIQTGYMIGERVLRPTRVAIAQ